LAGYPPTLLDVIDLETFVERTAIDGYTNAFSMWSRQDSVLSFMRLVSNEIVNELFLDLRPISRDGGLTAGTDYSRDLDDIEGNRADEEGGVSGILYQPAVVMREYPYATIDYIDATNVPLTLRQRGTTGEADGEFETIGMLNFGAIFSNRPNTPGRHIVTIPGINTEDLALGVSTFAAKKHLDVAVVYDAEIVGTKFSRSDTDHFNLFEIVSDPGSLIGENSRFTMMDLLPIITPVHIMRHGLRVRSLTSIFSRHSLATVNREQPQPSPPPAETTAPPPVAPTSRTVLPVEPDPVGGVYTRGYVGPENQRWYRRNSASGVRRYNGAGSGPIIPADTPLWVFHNGVDIRAPRNTPVRAVRDGIVVAAIPVSVSNTYGNVVMVYHEADDLFSLYAHLERFADNLVRPTLSRALRSYVSTEVKSGGTYSPVRVSAGDVIGYVGDSGSPVRRNAAGVQVAGGVHLHFEFGKKRNGTIYPSSSDRRNGLLPDYFRDPATALPGFPVSTDRPATPSEDLTISQDPVRLFREWGVTLPVGPSVAPGAEDASEDSTGEVDDSPESTVGATPESTEEDPGETTTRSSQPGFVDTPSTRRLLARWALLNDHWYQHNLEYLSGVIEMRGAPEIRAGYRLDLIDRNMSFYVEGVSHNWAYGQPMTTTLHVSRGQPNNPYPVYVLPFLPSFSATDTQRTVGSRLASYFVTPDSLSVRRSLKLERIRSGGLGSPATTSFGALGPDVRASPDTNEVDSSGDSDSVGSRYNEAIIPSVMGETNPEFEQELRRAEEIALGLTGRSSSLASSMSNPQATEAMSSQLDEIFTGSGT
jgi:murein DD-endopeptidase MepM/ murein hydrolase activator NlpD